MTTPRKVLFFGESHIHAVQVALKNAQGLFDGFDITAHRLTKIKNGTLIGTLNYQDLLLMCKALTPNDLVISLVGGNQHNSASLIQHSQPFSVCTASGTLETPRFGTTLVPRAAIKAHFERGLRHNDTRRIMEVAASGPHQTLHLSAPPPKADEAHIMKRFETDFAAKGLAEKGISPRALRQQFWEIQNEVLGDILNEASVPLLPPPEGTLTNEGFLHPDYYARDATHANVKYGTKVLEQVQTLLL